MKDPQHFTEEEQQASEPEYFDSDGKPVSLDKLCRDEPAWAANRLREETKRITALQAKARKLEEQRDGYAVDLERIRTDLQQRGVAPTIKMAPAVYTFIKELERRLGEGEAFNINHEVWARLTDRGREILQGQHDALPVVMPYKPVSEDDDGWSKWQLWCLMQELGGSNMAMGPPETFETEIRFADPALASARETEGEG